MPFGSIATGESVELFTLRNAHGIEVQLTNYGGISTSIKTPDRAGRFAGIGISTARLSSASIMKARLQEIDPIVAYEVNQSVFGCDAPRPDIGAHLLEVLGLPDPGERLPHHCRDQIKNS